MFSNFLEANNHSKSYNVVSNLYRNCEMSASDRSWMVCAPRWREKNAATAQGIDTKTSYHVSRLLPNYSINLVIVCVVGSRIPCLEFQFMSLCSTLLQYWHCFVVINVILNQHAIITAVSLTIFQSVSQFPSIFSSCFAFGDKWWQVVHTLVLLLRSSIFLCQSVDSDTLQRGR